MPETLESIYLNKSDIESLYGGINPIRQRKRGRREVLEEVYID
jgi:hypothetical protein